MKKIINLFILNPKTHDLVAHKTECTFVKAQNDTTFYSYVDPYTKKQTKGKINSILWNYLPTSK